MYPADSVFTNTLHQGAIADVSGASCSDKGNHGEDDKQLNFIKHQDCSAIAKACVYSSYLSSFSFSAKAPADLSVLSGTASQYSHKLGQLALKPDDWL